MNILKYASAKNKYFRPPPKLYLAVVSIKLLSIIYRKLLRLKNMKNDMSTTFSQQILSGRLLLVVIVGAKK